MQFGLGLALLGCVSVQGQFGSKALGVGDTIQPGKITLDYGFPPSKVRSERLGTRFKHSQYSHSTGGTVAVELQLHVHVRHTTRATVLLIASVACA
jgi:hypothetical protein